jgi:hypothetical protein
MEQSMCFMGKGKLAATKYNDEWHELHIVVAESKKVESADLMV